MTDPQSPDVPEPQPVLATSVPMSVPPPVVVNVVAPATAVPMSGLAVTSLILGILAVVFSFIPFVNFFSFILGGLALIFGVIAAVTANGVKRRGRGMGIAGLVLGAISLVIAVLMIVAFVAVVDDAVTVDVNSSAAGGAKGTLQDPLPFGTTVTLENGLEVNVGAPTSFTPSETAAVDTKQTYFWSVDVSLTNVGTESTALLGTSDAYTSTGSTCSALFDSAQFGDQLFALDGSLPPGKTRTSTLAFQCPTKGDPELVLSPDIFSPKLYYSTTAK